MYTRFGQFGKSLGDRQMTKTSWFRFCRKFTATHADWFPDWVVNWFIDKEARGNENTN
jgi:hypothetical protein